MRKIVKIKMKNTMNNKFMNWLILKDGSGNNINNSICKIQELIKILGNRSNNNNTK